MSDGTLRVIHSEPGDTELRVTHKLEAKFGHFLIGRHRKADLEIDNNIISRKHVVIKWVQNKDIYVQLFKIFQADEKDICKGLSSFVNCFAYVVHM